MRWWCWFTAAAITLAGCGRSQLIGDLDPVDGAVTDDRGTLPDNGPQPDNPIPPDGDGCNGGPSCGFSQACCSSGCTDVRSDRNNCGGCGISCGGSAQCVNGSCQVSPGCSGGCMPGSACCNDSCVDVQNDPSNCGECGLVCSDGWGCSGGRCVPPAPCGIGPACAIGTTCCGERCANTTSDPANCGRCGDACNDGQMCVNGACVGGGDMCGAGPACGFSQLCCGGGCINPQGDIANCGGCGRRCLDGQRCFEGNCIGMPTGCGNGPPCDLGSTCCNDSCVAPLFDPENCGGCGVVCAAGQRCDNGRCTSPMMGCGGGPACTPGSFCCGTRCSNTQVDPANCGACGRACARGQTCVGGSCQSLVGCGGGPGCATNFDCCSNRCIDTRTDPTNCGGCGIVCAAGQACVGARCVGAMTCGGGPLCTGGSLCCNDRCVDPTSDNAHCGACNNPCRAGLTCQNRACRPPPPGCGGGPACPAGQACCGDRCVVTATDLAHCGACDRACVGAPNTVATCAGGACASGACVMGFGDCNGAPRDGCEVNHAADAAHCGRCGNRCPTGSACVNGSCASGPSSGMEGAFEPRVNPTYLRPGVHNFTTINVPANVVVYVAGGGAESGTLDLRATGDVTIEGTIDVSGGPGGQSVITSRNTRQGRPGAGGFTGDPRTATPGPACEWIGGVSGGNGRGFMGTTGNCRVGSNSACITDSQTQLIFASPPAQFGGGAGVFSGYRAYGAGGGGYAGGAPGALGAPYPGQMDCTGASGGGGATAGRGGSAGAGNAAYNGRDGTLGQTQCDGASVMRPGIPAAWVGGGGGGSIGAEAAGDLAVARSFYPGSGGGGGSGDYLNRPAFGGTSGGGGGGGALRIWTATQITINGRVLANGGDGGDAYIGTSRQAGCDPQPGAAGGGGSGGVIFLQAPAITTGPRARITAVGGAGGFGSLYASGGQGGQGGPGRIRVSVTPSRCQLGGAFDPALSAGCAATPGVGTPNRVFVAAYPN